MSEVDYVALLQEQPEAFLSTLGDDGDKWGAAFCQFAKHNHNIDLPEQWTARWFSNCIGYNHERLSETLHQYYEGGKHMSIDDTEEAAARKAKAPRVTLADIEDAIAYSHYTTGGHIVATHHGGSVPPEAKSLEVLTICFLVMRNGFTVIGKSAPAHPDNYDKELGVKLAYEDAIRQLWPLMGFALRDRLWRDSEDAMTFHKAIAEGLVDDGTLSP